MVSLGKPRITGMVVITFLGGLWLAPGDIAHWRTIMTLIGTALLVAASNTLNMYLERDADALMERTRDRPLPRAVVSPEAALAFGTGLTCVGIALVFLGSNLLTGLLGLLAVGGYVAIYTPLKRTSAAALFVGAVPGALPPLMGWTAVTGHLDAPGLALFAVLFLWQIPHFLAIATYRGADYARAGFKVLPLAVSVRATRATIVAFSIVAGGGDDRARAAARRRPALRAVRDAAGRGVHRLGGSRVPPRRREPLGALAVRLFDRLPDAAVRRPGD